MRCPSDGAVLLVAHRAGIEIDICPTCRGVWLDRGELDKLIALEPSPARLTKPPSLRPFRTKAASHTPDSAHQAQSGGTSWLADLFDLQPPPASTLADTPPHPPAPDAAPPTYEGKSR